MDATNIRVEFPQIPHTILIRSVKSSFKRETWLQRRRSLIGLDRDVLFKFGVPDSFRVRWSLIGLDLVVLCKFDEPDSFRVVGLRSVGSRP